MPMKERTNDRTGQAKSAKPSVRVEAKPGRRADGVRCRRTNGIRESANGFSRIRFGDGMKECNRCGEFKDTEEFARYDKTHSKRRPTTCGQRWKIR